MHRRKGNEIYEMDGKDFFFGILVFVFHPPNLYFFVFILILFFFNLKHHCEEVKTKLVLFCFFIVVPSCFSFFYFQMSKCFVSKGIKVQERKKEKEDNEAKKKQ